MTRADPPSSLSFRRPRLDERVQTLIADIEKNIAGGTKFDASIPPHRELTEALYRVTYASPTHKDPGILLIRYADGTTGQPFKIRELWPVAEPIAWIPRLQIGTLSFRHLDYDADVDVYLIRDRETRGLSQAAIERLAASRMREILESPALVAGGCITVLQTGLEPLVVGLYRAVTEHFINRAKTDGEITPLYIRPTYYQDEDKIEAGSIWGQA
jgi:hypothetical protein